MIRDLAFWTRARLAARLLLSIDSPSEAAIESYEAAVRLEETKAGRLATDLRMALAERNASFQAMHRRAQEAEHIAQRALRRGLHEADIKRTYVEAAEFWQKSIGATARAK